MTAADDELAHRLGLWSALAKSGGPRGVKAKVPRELGMVGGFQGIYTDQERTEHLAASGVTMSVMHNGRSYADDMTERSLIYHYPATKRGGRDAREVEATKAAGRLGLPIFVIETPAANDEVRDVHLGWVRDWDDDARTVLIDFNETPLGLDPQPSEPDEDISGVVLVGARPTKKRLATVRENQPRFKFYVEARYGARCAVCTIAVPAMLEAAHVIPVSAGGKDHPSNGLVLCASHHRAFDARLFAIEPTTLRIHPAPRVTLTDLGITRDDLGHLRRKPHPGALDACWTTWTELHATPTPAT